MHGASTGARFSQNRRFRNKCEKTAILESFSEAKTKKNREKMVLKNMCFVDIDVSSFFSILEPFWEVPGPPKNHQKIEKIVFRTVLEPVWDPVSILDTILERYGWILRGILEDFGRFWKHFGKVFGLSLIHI